MQRGGASHRQALAGLLGAPHAEILLQTYRIEPGPDLVESRVHRDLGVALLHLQANKLQAQLAIGQRYKAERCRYDNHPVGIALAPLREHQAPPHVQDPLVAKRISGASQQCLAVDQYP